METRGGSALDGVTATPGPRTIPTATAPTRDSALKILTLDIRTRNTHSHRHAVGSHRCSRGKKLRQLNEFLMRAGTSQRIVPDVLVLNYRYGAE
jgi:hypothetical protein